MKSYQYRALDNSGKETKGVIQGDSPKHARQLLREQNLNPLEINPVIEKASKTGEKKSSQLQRYKASTLELALMTRQLATLLAAGIPIEEALLSVSEQTEKQQLKNVLSSVRGRVLEGHTLATGMSDFPKVFSKLYCGTIAAGEKSGHLDIILNRLADYIERQQQIKQKIQQAMIYPSIMIVVSLAIVTFLLIYVVPKIIGIFSNTHQALPLVTIILLHISSFVKSYGLYCLLGLTGLVILFFQLLKNKNFKKSFHKILLKLPLIGNGIKVVNTARFSRTVGILFAAGVPILEAMTSSAALIKNIPIREAVQLATEKVREGGNISQALKNTTYFPPMSIHLIASGETSGNLPDMLARAADNQDQGVESLIDNTLTLFEPMMILVMGGIVLFIVLAILLPIFSLDQFAGQ